MKLSVSLSDEDVETVDRYLRASGLGSRSAVLQHAVRMLRSPDLEADYEAAWNDWEASGEHAAWDRTAGDGVVDAAR